MLTFASVYPELYLSLTMKCNCIYHVFLLLAMNYDCIVIYYEM